MAASPKEADVILGVLGPRLDRDMQSLWQQQAELSALADENEGVPPILKKQER